MLLTFTSWALHLLAPNQGASTVEHNDCLIASVQTACIVESIREFIHTIVMPIYLLAEDHSTAALLKLRLSLC